MHDGTVVIALYAAIALAGCQGTGLRTGYGQPQTQSPPPFGDTRSGQLPPVGQNEFPKAPTMQGLSEHELPVPAADAPQVTRESILGRWTISTGGGSCDVFLALTKWTGGYRAASRGCSGQAALISAWDVEGNQVILNDSSGNRFAALYPSGEQRFDGATAMGQPVRLDRYARKP